MGFQDTWELRSLVRSRPRRVLANDMGNLYFYPVSRQPLCIHPVVASLGEEARQVILIQSLYKYSNDIVMIESAVINRSAFNIVKNFLPVEFDFTTRLTASTVIVDESYHAYVALDCMQQVEEITRVKALPFPPDVELSKAIDSVKSTLADQYHSSFELIAVCIAENTLTKDIVQMAKEPGVNQFFQHIMSDHLIDEARHSKFFSELLREFWSKLNQDFQEAIGKLLPLFIKLYLSNESQKEFDKKILDSLELETGIIQQIIEETHGQYEVTQHHPMAKNILQLLSIAKVLEHTMTSEAFKKIHWLA